MDKKSEVLEGLKELIYSIFFCLVGIGAFYLGNYADTATDDVPILEIIILLFSLIGIYIGFMGVIGIAHSVFSLLAYLWGLATKPKQQKRSNSEAPEAIIQSKQPRKPANKKPVIIVFLFVLAIGLSAHLSYNYGYENGYSGGYEAGHSEGYKTGYSNGRADGYDTGKAFGVRVGKKEGYDNGYSQGFYDAKSNAKKTHSNSNSNTSSDVIVYVTDSGSKYHRYGCQYLWNSCNSIYLSDAKRQGYSPCSKCNPPR